MNNRHSSDHLSAEQIQAFLDGELPERERGRTEEHLASCVGCSVELDGWRVLYDDLQDLPTLAPNERFTDQVLAGVEVAKPLPLIARLGARIHAQLSGSPSHGHPDDARLQDWVEGLLPGRQAARIRTHVESCTTCASHTTAWRLLLGALDGLDRFAPAETFAARVMDDVHVPILVPATRAVPEWRRALARAALVVRRLVPRTPKAWATMCGVALTPAITLGLMVWTVFTHPTVTPGALASFAWWKVSDLAVFTWHTVATRTMQSAEAFGVFSFIQSLALSPAMLVTAFLVFSVATVMAAWVLYRNLNTYPADGGYAHASLH